MSMPIHTLSKCLFRLPYILFIAFKTCYKIDKVEGVARQEVVEVESFVVGVRHKRVGLSCVLTCFASAGAAWFEPRLL